MELHPEMIPAALAEQVARDPAALAVVDGEARASYGELARLVRVCAGQLAAAGAGPGDRIAVLAPPGLAFWVSFLATASIGAVWVGLGTRHQREELLHVVRDCDPCLVLASPFIGERDYREDIEAVRGHAPARWLDPDGMLADIDTDAAERPANPLSPDDPALIVYTSGTTGRPKGAVLSHRALIGGARAQQQVYADPRRPVQLCAFPTNHIACIGDTCLTNLVSGGALVFTPGFDPDQQLALMQRERASVWGGIPTMLMLMLSSPALASTDLSSVDYIVWGGAAMPSAIIEALGGFAARRVAVYGMTETGCNVTHTPAGADTAALAGTIGVPLPEVDIRIMAAQGEEGELEIRSPFNMTGYWRNEAATAAAFTDDGYLRTGDIGRWNPDGSITLVGRRSDMFKSGGFNVYPREVELAIEACTGVVAAAVVSVPDPLYQEVGHAFVMGHPALDQGSLRRELAGKLSNYKCPKRITVLAELPILANGKVDKVALRAGALSDMA
jgi:acyl-CoA synthetase (AMP-forming)/AMP-acid ligase II